MSNITEEDKKAIDDYSFQVPYDGTNKFYDEEKAKHFQAGIEHARKELAELKAENDDHTETIKRQKELLSEAGETLKRYKDVLETVTEYFESLYVQPRNWVSHNETYQKAKDALSGTKETE